MAEPRDDRDSRSDREARPPAAAAVPAATVLLVRDGARGLEVFLVERHRRVDFATGALVFPGGKVEAADASPALRERMTGAGELSAEAAALRAAAIRETFEESGVLLARARGESALLSAERVRALEPHRRRVERDAETLAELAREESLELACDALVPFAHWITPEGLPKRFDTHFFLAAAPEDQAALHDGAESVDSLWLPPSEALAEAEAGRRTVIFPTRMNLRKLARAGSATEALETARAEPVVTVCPWVAKTETGPVVRIPEGAGYDVLEAPLEV